MKTIKIDDEVWHALQKRAIAFEDTPNSVLRRLLHLDKTTNRNNSISRIARGTKTQQKAFREPILKTLYELGGSAEVSKVLERVEVLMKNVLKDVDYQLLPDGKTFRWRNTAEWERHDMVRDGLLSKNSPRGIWELTEKGAAAAEKIIDKK